VWNVLQRKRQLAILKWRRVKTWITLSTLLRFFEMTLQKIEKKRKKSRFLILKKRKKRILEL